MTISPKAYLYLPILRIYGIKSIIETYLLADRYLLMLAWDLYLLISDLYLLDLATVDLIETSIDACLILNHCPHQAYCCLRPSTPPFRPERDCRLPSPNGYGLKVTFLDVDGSIRRFGNKPRVSPTSFERTHLDEFLKGYQRVMQGIGSKPRALAKGTEAEAVPNA